MRIYFFIIHCMARFFYERGTTNSVDIIGNSVQLVERDSNGIPKQVRQMVFKRDSLSVCLGFVQSKMCNCTEEQYQLLKTMRDELETRRAEIDECEKVG